MVNAYEKHIIPCKIACQIPPNTKKSVLDAAYGFHVIKFVEESQPLTTFITEWGKMSLCLPQSFFPSTDTYTRKYDELIEPVPCKAEIVNSPL